jgi:hypothetical protein
MPSNPPGGGVVLTKITLDTTVLNPSAELLHMQFFFSKPEAAYEQ